MGFSVWVVGCVPCVPFRENERGAAGVGLLGGSFLGFSVKLQPNFSVLLVAGAFHVVEKSG